MPPNKVEQPLPIINGTPTRPHNVTAKEFIIPITSLTIPRGCMVLHGKRRWSASQNATLHYCMQMVGSIPAERELIQDPVVYPTEIRPQGSTATQQQWNSCNCQGRIDTKPQLKLPALPILGVILRPSRTFLVGCPFSPHQCDHNKHQIHDLYLSFAYDRLLKYLYFLPSLYKGVWCSSGCPDTTPFQYDCFPIEPQSVVSRGRLSSRFLCCS
jgi:hypothetical protein